MWSLWKCQLTLRDHSSQAEGSSSISYTLQSVLLVISQSLWTLGPCSFIPDSRLWHFINYVLYPLYFFFTMVEATADAFTYVSILFVEFLNFQHFIQLLLKSVFFFIQFMHFFHPLTWHSPLCHWVSSLGTRLNSSASLQSLSSHWSFL